LKLTAGSAAAAVAGLAAPAAIAAGKDKILIGVPSSLSTPYGVADDTDHLNGTTMAVEEINAAGGVLGREIELFVPDVDKLSPESCRQAIAACIDKKVHAISNAFLFAPIPAMDESAKYKCPYLQGNTQRNATLAYKADPKKYSQVLQTDPSEVNYGWTYPLWLTQEPKDTHRRRAGGLLPDNSQGSSRVDSEIQFRTRCCDRHSIPGQRLEPCDSKAQGSRCWGNHDRPLGGR
jgi:branched-chain amino acid transport system substrate-binding protein